MKLQCLLSFVHECFPQQLKERYELWERTPRENGSPISGSGNYTVSEVLNRADGKVEVESGKGGTQMGLT